MDHAYRTRWLGEGGKNKLFLISLVIYVLKHRGIIGGEHFCNLKLVYFKYLVYGTYRPAYIPLAAGTFSHR